MEIALVSLKHQEFLPATLAMFSCEQLFANDAACHCAACAEDRPGYHPAPSGGEHDSKPYHQPKNGADRAVVVFTHVLIVSKESSSLIAVTKLRRDDIRQNHPRFYRSLSKLDTSAASFPERDCT